MAADYFKDFSNVIYSFGEEKSTALFKDLSMYVEVIDIIKDASSAYMYYHIMNNDRPDQVSFKLYNDDSYYWTFFLMNDHIREQGWPLNNAQILKKAMDDHPDMIITTRSTLTDKLKIGQTITGQTSGATATIAHRNLDLGQLALHNITGTFRAGENINSTNANGVLEVAVVHSYELEYNTAHHYVDGDGNYVDIDPTVGPGIYAEVTHLDHYVALNEELKIIKVIKPENIVEIARAYSDALRS